jgi:transcription initiation factor IIE alpha subunit
LRFNRDKANISHKVNGSIKYFKYILRRFFFRFNRDKANISHKINGSIKGYKYILRRFLFNSIEIKETLAMKSTSLSKTLNIFCVDLFFRFNRDKANISHKINGSIKGYKYILRRFLFNSIEIKETLAMKSTSLSKTLNIFCVDLFFRFNRDKANISHDVNKERICFFSTDIFSEISSQFFAMA